MNYRSNGIPNLRTIKAQRGEALKIDLGKVFSGTLTAWMKREPNDLEYRSFEVQEGRYLYLTKEKASDYIEGGTVVSAIGGKWYFDVEQDPGGGEDSKTIYRGTILFQNDITGSLGSEQPAPPDGRYRTIDIAAYLPLEEGWSGESDTASDLFIEHKKEIDALKGVRVDSSYKFDASLIGVPTEGYVSLDTDDFTTTSTLYINKLDGDGFNNSYFIEALEIDNFLTLRSADSTVVVAFKLLSVAQKVGDVYSFDVALESNVGTIFDADQGINVEGLVKAEGGVTLAESVEVIGVGTVGALSDGDVLIEGMPYTEFVKRLVQRAYPPTEPTVALTVIPGVIQEVGSTVSFTLTPSFNQNDAGSINQVVFKRNGTIIQTQSDLTSFVDVDQVISAGSHSYTVEISYDAGPEFTGPGKIGQILAGTKIGGDSVLGAYLNWFGPYGISDPTTGEDIRTLGNSYNNAFTLNTGTTATRLVIAVPSTKSLTSVIDQDALNANITGSYELSGIITTVPDGGGNPVNYKVYILTIAVPYSTNHRHNITIN